MQRRLASWLSGGLALLLILTACGQPALVGTDLGARPAPDFRLIDQNSQSVGLADLHGKAVALTFLYSTCPDVCPLISSKLHTVHSALGSDAERVALVVISVDPERDTAEQLQRYTTAVRMDGRWQYLTGDHQALAPVWAAYGIAVFPGPAGTINHTSAIFVIDREGRQRVLMREDFNPDDLVTNLRVLARS